MCPGGKAVSRAVELTQTHMLLVTARLWTRYTAHAIAWGLGQTCV